MYSCTRNVKKTLLILILYAHIMQITSSELEKVLADINKNGFTESLLFDVIKLDKKSSDKDLIKQLESPKVQHTLISAALEYASSKANDVVKRSIQLERNSWTDYCSYRWVRWLSFMNCSNSESTADLDREEHHNFQVIKDNGKCYQSPSSSYW